MEAMCDVFVEEIYQLIASSEESQSAPNEQKLNEYFSEAVDFMPNSSIKVYLQENYNCYFKAFCRLYEKNQPSENNENVADLAYELQVNFVDYRKSIEDLSKLPVQNRVTILTGLLHHTSPENANNVFQQAADVLEGRNTEYFYQLCVKLFMLPQKLPSLAIAIQVTSYFSLKCDGLDHETCTQDNFKQFLNKIKLCLSMLRRPGLNLKMDDKFEEYTYADVIAAMLSVYFDVFVIFKSIFSDENNKQKIASDLLGFLNIITRGNHKVILDILLQVNTDLNKDAVTIVVEFFYLALRKLPTLNKQIEFVKFIMVSKQAIMLSKKSRNHEKEKHFRSNTKSQTAPTGLLQWLYKNEFEIPRNITSVNEFVKYVLNEETEFSLPELTEQQTEPTINQPESNGIEKMETEPNVEDLFFVDTKPSGEKFESKETEEAQLEDFPLIGSDLDEDDIKLTLLTDSEIDEKINESEKNQSDDQENKLEELVGDELGEILKIAQDQKEDTEESLVNDNSILSGITITEIDDDDDDTIVAEQTTHEVNYDVNGQEMKLKGDVEVQISDIESLNPVIDKLNVNQPPQNLQNSVNDKSDVDQTLLDDDSKQQLPAADEEHSEKQSVEDWIQPNTKKCNKNLKKFPKIKLRTPKKKLGSPIKVDSPNIKADSVAIVTQSNQENKVGEVRECDTIASDTAPQEEQIKRLTPKKAEVVLSKVKLSDESNNRETNDQNNTESDVDVIVLNTTECESSAGDLVILTSDTESKTNKTVKKPPRRTRRTPAKRRIIESDSSTSSKSNSVSTKIPHKVSGGEDEDRSNPEQIDLTKSPVKVLRRSRRRLDSVTSDSASEIDARPLRRRRNQNKSISISEELESYSDTINKRRKTNTSESDSSIAQRLTQKKKFKIQEDDTDEEELDTTLTNEEQLADISVTNTMDRDESTCTSDSSVKEKSLKKKKTTTSKALKQSITENFSIADSGVNSTSLIKSVIEQSKTENSDMSDSSVYTRSLRNRTISSSQDNNQSETENAELVKNYDSDNITTLPKSKPPMNCISNSQPVQNSVPNTPRRSRRLQLSQH